MGHSTPSSLIVMSEGLTAQHATAQRFTKLQLLRSKPCSAAASECEPDQTPRINNNNHKDTSSYQLGVDKERADLRAGTLKL